MQNGHFKLSREGILAGMLALFFIMPIFVFGEDKEIFVDQDANGSEDGSRNHPYQSIDKALDHAKGGTVVRVKNGTYKENITIPKDVKIVSESEKRDKVIIKAKDDDKPVVTMKDDSEIWDVTVKDGRHGIRVEDDAHAVINNVIIKDNERDGVHIAEGSRDRKHRVLLDHVLIKDNGRAGVFANKRYVLILNSDIGDNKTDGIDLAAGSRAWLEDNSFTGNGGSGAKFVIDQSEIWTKDNNFRGNHREGIEINSYGQAGKVGLKKAVIKDNSRYGIAQVARTKNGTETFGGLILDGGANVNRIENNGIGNLSKIVRSF